jgi:hypothetical protein
MDSVISLTDYDEISNALSVEALKARKGHAESYIKSLRIMAE